MMFDLQKNGAEVDPVKREQHSLRDTGVGHREGVT